MKLYIAGPMTGLPEFNYPAFNAAAFMLHERGYQPLNPAVGPKLDKWQAYMRRGIRMLTQADGVALLHGWQDSTGASLERHIAVVLCMEVRMLDEWLVLADRAVGWK